MANEVKATVSLEASKNNFRIPRYGGTQQQITMSGQGGGLPGIVTATTAGTDISLTEVSTVGWCYVKNIDTANYIELGPKNTGTFYPFLRLQPGEEQVFRLSPSIPGSSTFHAKSNAADCKLQVIVLEN